MPDKLNYATTTGIDSQEAYPYDTAVQFANDCWILRSSLAWNKFSWYYSPKISSPTMSLTPGIEL